MRHGNERKERLTAIGVVTSVVFCVLKFITGLVSGSIAIISDALNALLDVVTYTAVYISVRIQERQPDADHHFGHRRAEPLAGLLVAIFATILGSTLIKDAMVSLFVEPHTPEFSLSPVIILLLSIAVKIVLARRYALENRSTGSPAMHASYIDSRNDVLASAIALIGFAIGRPFDDVAALLIGVWIIYSGGRIGMENLGYLMGVAPSDEKLLEIRKTAAATPAVLGLNELRAHYVGDKIHVEIHIELDDTLSLREAHDIGVNVQRRLEALPGVQSAFVHIDPVHPDTDIIRLGTPPD